KREEGAAQGSRRAAGVVTSAAIVMVGVFSIFATLPILDMKEAGVGLAAAVLIDATIVRAVLLPATMKLLGDWNWYLPKWLDWLPRLEHKPSPPQRLAAAEPAPPAPAPPFLRGKRSARGPPGVSRTRAQGRPVGSRSFGRGMTRSRPVKRTAP